MQRKIMGFYLDEEKDWTAELDCGHSQHVRHNPPLVFRSWVLTESDRQSKLGEKLNCLRCERLEFPQDFVSYQKTPVFEEDSIPKGLQSEHSTKPGVWAKLHILEGRLKYSILSPINKKITLDSTQEGVIVAEVPHYVEPEGTVRFYVEFFRKKR